MPTVLLQEDHEDRLAVAASEQQAAEAVARLQQQLSAAEAEAQAARMEAVDACRHVP
jgi:hypothetical protein